MHIHILGICGTFMGGLALLARELGHEVTGSDENVYPPMSTQLREQGIELYDGYKVSHLDPVPDCVVIGNALSRGNTLVEHVLNQGIPYTSGPQWLAEHVLASRWVLAVAGTHGKTTTASQLAWILDYAGLEPGFLIGGVAKDLGVSARLGSTPFFVVEADEYDSAFFDKRSKFVHYRPRTTVLNNLEFDHADIFPDLEAIKRQFHHLVRTIPSTGLIIAPADDVNIQSVLEMGCWSRLERTGFSDGDVDSLDWCVTALTSDGSKMQLRADNQWQGELSWGQTGRHNMANAVSAVAAARHAGVPPQVAMEALTIFSGVKRRMDHFGKIRGISFYDDFAHHPTAIKTTLAGLRSKVGGDRIFVALELRSNSMRMGVHTRQLADALALADRVLLLKPQQVSKDLIRAVDDMGRGAALYESAADIVDHLNDDCRTGDHVVVMSNGSFDGIQVRLLEKFASSGNSVSKARRGQTAKRII